ncbi:MAG: TlpA family protein disulfide reductase [Bacteroidetes bacterium]|nr:TlpA family protein disulfide reductase [Bacteroidota bacterium]
MIQIIKSKAELLNNLKTLAVFILASFIFMGCNDSKEGKFLKTGNWKLVFSIGAEELPVLLSVTDTAIYIINGLEKIKVDEFEFLEDSIIIKLPVYDTEIRAKLENGNLYGNWYNYTRSSFGIIPVTAFYGLDKRFIAVQEPLFDISGKWEIDFISQDDSGNVKLRKALGVFSQEGAKVTGSILTPTGDYRFLEGIVDGKEVKLSSFNGASVYLFTANISEDGFQGMYYSGIHHQQQWQGKRNEQFKLPDSDTLTRQAIDIPVAFSFPGLDGELFQYPNPEYNGKVVILQLMGSWCPNCLDESLLFSQWHKKYKSDGLEVIALAFENTDDFQKSKQSVERLKNRIEANYTFLIAGKSDKQQASEMLPFLDKVMAFPTTVFIDKQGKVRKIHTGFSGPATGAAYEEFVTETIGFLEGLLKE